MDIYKNICYRSSDNSRKRVETVSRGQRKPVFLQWGASENIEKYADEKPHGAEACGDEDVCPEDNRVPPDPEYSHIKQKCRIFRHCDSSSIAELRCVAVFEEQSKLFWGNLACMMAETRGEHQEMCG